MGQRLTPHKYSLVWTQQGNQRQREGQEEEEEEEEKK
jgi:hypothetical protein